MKIKTTLTQKRGDIDTQRSCITRIVHSSQLGEYSRFLREWYGMPQALQAVPSGSTVRLAFYISDVPGRADLHMDSKISCPSDFEAAMRTLQDSCRMMLTRAPAREAANEP